MLNKLQISLLCFIVFYSPSNPNLLHKQRKSKAEQLHNKAHEQLCTVSHPVKLREGYHPHKRFPRSAKNHERSQNKPSTYGTAVYFNGSENGLKFTTLSAGQIESAIPRQDFTIELWVRPEGGQTDPTVIIEVTDICDQESSHPTWQIGIATKNGNAEQAANFFLSLQTEMAFRRTVLWSLKASAPAEWVHIAGTYNGSILSMFINGAQVAVSKEQTGALFSDVRHHCKQMFIAGSNSKPLTSNVRYGYRGSVDELRIWSTALSQQQIVSGLFHVIISSGSLPKDLLIWDSFDTLNQWDASGNIRPSVIPSDISEDAKTFRLQVPPCGQTICDHPDIIQSYANHWRLRLQKTLRYRVINVADYGGSNTSVSSEQIRNQHAVLNDAFRPYNISWSLELVEVANTALRRKTIVFGCDSKKVGNKRCNVECRHQITGNDGGDCDDIQSYCNPELLGNRKCDHACNRPQYGWDQGECCNASREDVHSTCIDPTSPLRGYIGIDEFKRILNFTNEDALTVTFAEWSNTDLIGLSTFPWEKEIHTVYGGIVLKPDRFGTDGHKDNLIHEIGHSLGLWHVHHGVSEMACDDPCREHEPSLLTGDLAADTNPTPKNMACRDPSGFTKSGSITGKCAEDKFHRNTPFNNYMSYADEHCTDHFTMHQTARMHCYIDLVYRGWLETPENTNPLNANVIPLPPKIVSTSTKPKPSVTLIWLPPLGDEVCRPTGSTLGQASCDSDGRVIQYAAKAHSSGPFKLSGYWAPHQAIGPPDADVCEASTKAWLPDVSSCNDPDACSLLLEPELNLPARQLYLWVAWNAAGGVRQLRVVYVDGSLEEFINITAFCDVPYTVSLSKPSNVAKIQIFTANPFVSIDAMQLVSPPYQSVCGQCRKTTYNVHRTPLFRSAPVVETSQRFYTDSEINPKLNYSYYVSVLNHGIPSPHVQFSWNQAFCGDGRIDSELEEECDDENSAPDDGCSETCKIEPNFSCKGEPSLCYVFSGDGICEEFEKTRSINDCGHYTPEGFEDQWASGVDGEPFNCSSHPRLIGPPSSHECFPNLHTPEHIFWNQCSFAGSVHLETIVHFENPVLATSVIIHLASDGLSEFSTEPRFLTLFLIDTNNLETLVPGSDNVVLTCQRNPIEFPVVQDLSKPFSFTKSLKIRRSNTAILLTGVRIRTWRFFNPDKVLSCAQKGLLYQPQSNMCIQNQCVQQTCAELNIHNALVKCNDMMSADAELSGLAAGTKCAVQCARGYVLHQEKTGNNALKRRHVEAMSNAQTTCLNGQWTNTYVCRPISCGKPRIPHATVVCAHGTDYRNVCRFGCVAPAKLRGTDVSLTCGEHGLWSIPEAYCHLNCPAPSFLKRNGEPQSIQCHSRSGSINVSENGFPIGAYCDSVCRSGFHAAGHQMTKRKVRFTCQGNGLWKGPKCIPVTCPKPRMIYYGLYNCTHGYQMGSTCRYFCPGTRTARVSICQANGMWSPVEPCILPQISCPALRQPREFRLTCPKQRFIVSPDLLPTNYRKAGAPTRSEYLGSLQKTGSVCKVRCKAYSYESVMEHIVTVERGLTMQMLQPIPMLTCTAQGHWEPSIKALVCVKRCNKEFLADGWCDFQNNRGYCGWDGGDCCASTAKGGKVRLMFPALCTSHLCQCLDPYTIENRNDLQRAKIITEDGLENENDTAIVSMWEHDMGMDNESANDEFGSGKSYLTKLAEFHEFSKNNEILETKFDRVANSSESRSEFPVADLLNDTVFRYESSKEFILHNDAKERQTGLFLMEQFSRRFKRLRRSRSLRSGRFKTKRFNRFRAAMIRALRKHYDSLELKS